MSEVKNLKVVAAGLCLGVTLLTGCGDNPNEIVIGGVSKDVILNYESEIPTGTFTYDKLNEYVKIVTLSNNDINYSFLLIKNKISYKGGRYTSAYDHIEYIDFKTGTIIYAYDDYSISGKEISWIVGENLTLVCEKDITGYLFQENFIKKEYEVGEILDFYEEKIKPTLNSSEKELVK